MQYGVDPSPHGQRQVMEIIQSQKFRSYLQSNESCMFMMETGEPFQGDMPGPGAVSPLTYFGAVLAQTLAKTAIATPFNFLSGNHTSPTDPLFGVAGWLRVLNFQLLMQYTDRLDLSFMDDDLIEGIARGSLAHLLRLLRGLIGSVVRSVGRSAITCWLDGASVFESDQFKDDFLITIASLQQLLRDVDSCRGLLVLKIGLSFPYTSRYARELFAPDRILTLSR